MTDRTLIQQRRVIRVLLDERQAADAMASYYAFHHPDESTRLFAVEDARGRADAYVALSRTGIDLFRPLVTLRLNPDDPEGSADLLYQALRPGQEVFIHSPLAYRPLLAALFQIRSEQHLRLHVLEAKRFEPVVNVLVMRSSTPDGMPRYIIRPTNEESDQEIGASATLNWQSPGFAEISVYTNPSYRQRGWGRSVVSALARDLLQHGKTPLYEVALQNEPSLHLAEALGFVDAGADKLFLEATLRSRP